MSPLFGAHMSVAGGLPRAVARAVVHGCEAFQIFAKNANQWHGRVLSASEIREFRAAVQAAGIGPVVSHASYLINLATANQTPREQSIAAMGDEIDRAEALGLLGVVLHPGCYTDGNESRGIELIARALDRLLAERQGGTTKVVLEQTAGQGTSIGARFEQLAAILERVGHPSRVAVCLDTCHLLAAGYDLSSIDGYNRTFREFRRLIGWDRLLLFHLNDSKRPLGSRVDRHEHIGKGFVGREAFRRLVNDPRFRALPMLLETPKSRDRSGPAIEVDRFDARNLRTLRNLARGSLHS